jgi:2-succinyl-5-enolpyruvyl-6-hydroxy-3-cyclohexene-1-carboxylate synthase
VLRLGDTPACASLRPWLTGSPQVLVDPQGVWHDPTRAAETVLAAAAAPTCDALAAALEMRAFEPEPAWLRSWLDADAVVPRALAETPDPFEPKALAVLEPALPDDALLWVSSSMPVRDVEAFFPKSPKPLRFLANRGANGIDGVVSSAAGAALASGRRTYLLTGELALLHDLGGLLAAARAGVQLTILCLNNGGGGIFDFLPVAEHAKPSDYERHVATPAWVDLATLAALGGLKHRHATSPDEIRAAAREPALIEVRTDRARNVALHREVAAGIATAIATEAGTVPESDV